MLLVRESKVLISCALRRRPLLLLPVGLKPVCCSGHRSNGLVVLKLAQALIIPG